MFNLNLNNDSDSEDEVFKNAAQYENDGPKLPAFRGAALNLHVPVDDPQQQKKPSGGLLGLMGLQAGNEEEIDKKWKERANQIHIKDSVRRLQDLDLDFGNNDDDDDSDDDSHVDNSGDMDGSYDITNNGTLKVGSYSVQRNNRRTNSLIENQCQEDLVEMCSLGAGAGGSVVKCLYKPTGLIVALKSIDVTDRGKREQLLRELRELDSGNCAYLVGMHNMFFSDGQIHLALEYMDRGSLQSLIEDSGPLHDHVLADIARQMLLGLMHMHNMKKIHRDIKPGNVLVNKYGEVKISDFGIMAQLDDAADNCNTFVGTTVYMSPERIDTLSYSFPGDIWSAGLTLMFCATGKCPIPTVGGYWAVFQRLKNDPSPELGPEYSEDLRDFVAKCLIKDPKDRWDAVSLLMHPFIQKKSLGPRRTIPYWPVALNMVGKDDVRGNSNMNGTIQNLSEVRKHIRSNQNLNSNEPARSNVQTVPPVKTQQQTDFEKTQLALPVGMKPTVQSNINNSYVDPLVTQLAPPQQQVQHQQQQQQVQQPQQVNSTNNSSLLKMNTQRRQVVSSSTSSNPSTTNTSVPPLATNTRDRSDSTRSSSNAVNNAIPTRDRAESKSMLMSTSTRDRAESRSSMSMGRPTTSTSSTTTTTTTTTTSTLAKARPTSSVTVTSSSNSTMQTKPRQSFSVPATNTKLPEKTRSSSNATADPFVNAFR